MNSDIDISRFVRNLSFSERIKKIADRRPACIQSQADVDDHCGDSDVTFYIRDDVEPNDVTLKNDAKASDVKNDVDCDYGVLSRNLDRVRRHLPQGSGPFSVGCVDVMENNTDEGSFFRLFYPIQKTDVVKRNKQWPLWLPRKQYGHGYAIFLKKKKFFGKLFNWMGGDIYIPALWQAPLMQTDDLFPVIVLSHGIGGNRTTYSTFCCEMASHGFVVVTPEHRDGSASMTYSLKDNLRRTVIEHTKDNDFVPRRSHSMHRSQSFKEEWKSFEHTDPLGIAWDDYAYRNKQVRHRAAECSRLLDIISDINEGKSIRNCLGFNFSLKQFKGKLDLSKVAFAGHSFGGSTCVATLALDKRFQVGIMLDAWMHPLNEQMCADVTQPVLMLNYEKFQWKKNVQQMSRLQNQNVDRPMITIKGACHQAISDFQFIVSKPFGKLMEVRSDLSPKVAMEINSKATLAFLAKHLELKNVVVDDDILNGKHKQTVLGTTLDLTSES